jgi:hypothetical protein
MLKLRILQTILSNDKPRQTFSGEAFLLVRPAGFEPATS